MDSLEDTKRFLFGDEEDDDNSYMEAAYAEMRPYRKAWRVHGLASRNNVTVFTPKIGLEAEPVIPVPITIDEDFEKLIKEYDKELRAYVLWSVYRSRETEEAVNDIMQQSWMRAYVFIKTPRWHPISAAVFSHVQQAPFAWQEGPEEIKQANVRAWLYAIVRHNIVDYLREEKERHLLPYDPDIDDRECDEMDQPELAFMYKEHRAEIDQALEKLPEQIAKVLSLTIQGYTNVEIARKFNCSPNTVGSHLQRGRKYLPKVLSTKKDMKKRKKPMS